MAERLRAVAKYVGTAGLAHEHQEQLLKLLTMSAASGGVGGGTRTVPRPSPSASERTNRDAANRTVRRPMPNDTFVSKHARGEELAPAALPNVPNDSGVGAERFAAASKAARSLNLGPTEQLQLYGLFKQATAGACASEKPARGGAVASAKWGAWMQLGSLPRSDAATAYVAFVSKHARGEERAVAMLSSESEPKEWRLRMWSRQRDLPRLPLPSLAESCSKFLRSAAALRHRAIDSEVTQQE